MYTPPVTPWESEMPEVGDLTPSKHDQKKEQKVVFSRGKEPPKAGRMTGVKS